jgi:uroporphyrinogen-III synthase
VAAGERVLVVRGDIAGDRVAERLRARGAAVDDVVAYRTIEGPQGSVERLRRAMGGVTGPDAVLFTSGSTVRGLLAIGRAAGCDVGAIPAICLGPETAREARALGFRVVAVAPVPDVASLALTTATALVAELQETS